MHPTFPCRLSGMRSQLAMSTPAASFLGTDTTTKGAWNGVYGGAGYILPEPNTSGTASLPAGMSWSIANQQFFTYASGNYVDAAAEPQLPSSSSTFLSVWYSLNVSPYQFTLTLTQTTPHTYALAVYCADVDNASRTGTVQITDTSGNALTSAIALSSYAHGTYLKFRFINSIKVVYTNTTSGGSLANIETQGLFLDTTT